MLGLKTVEEKYLNKKVRLLNKSSEYGETGVITGVRANENLIDDRIFRFVITTDDGWVVGGFGEEHFEVIE